MMHVLMLLALAASVPAFGATFVVEEPLATVPTSVSASILRTISAQVYVDRKGEPCRFVGKNVALELDSSAHDWIVTTAGACAWVASAAPVWILRKTMSEYKLVLHYVTYDVTVGSASANGLRNIATHRATAARSEVQLWKFDGEQYRTSRNVIR
jgi:hypothetical protein